VRLGSDHFGSDHLGSEILGNDHLGSDHLGSEILGNDNRETACRGVRRGRSPGLVLMGLRVLVAVRVVTSVLRSDPR
jgi:hypothetical protein